MSASEFVRFIWGRRWPLAIAVALSASLAMLLASRQTPIYEARAKVFVGPRTVATTETAQALEELAFGRELIKSYEALFVSRPLAIQVIERLHLAIKPADLLGQLSTRILFDTRIIEVSVDDADPARAAAIADTAIDVLGTYLLPRTAGAGSVQVTVAEPAVVPTLAVSPRVRRSGLVGGFLGGLLALVVLAFRRNLDETIRTPEELEALGIKWLGTIPRIPPRNLEGILIVDHANATEAESIRLLRTTVNFLAAKQGIRSIAVTSARPLDGKSMLALNLAAAFAAAGQKALLIDADLRSPSVHTLLGISSEPGLVNATGGVSREGGHQATRVPGLTAIPAGSHQHAPAELLTAGAVKRVLSEEDEFGIVIIDCPPLLSAAESAVIAAQADAVLLIVMSGTTTIAEFQAAQRLLDVGAANQLGVVVNGYSRPGSDRGYGYGYGYGGRQETTATNGRGPRGHEVAEADPQPDDVSRSSE